MPVQESFRRSRVAVAALFCFLGFQYGTWVSRVPALQERMGLTPAQVGVLLLATGVGAAVSFPLTARLIRRFGSRRVAAGSAVALMAILVALAVPANYPVTLLILLADGVAVGCLNVAMNAQGAALEARFARTTMAKLHAVFSAGLFTAALLASAATAVSEMLAVHFTAAILLLAVLVGVAWRGTLAGDEPVAADPGAPRRRWNLPSAVSLLLGAAVVCGTVTEGAMNDWSALYLRDVAGAPTELTPMGIAVVSAAMVVARLFADGWRDRWGDRTVVVAGSVLAGLGLLGGLFAGGTAPALIAFGCVGAGMAAVTPCIYVAAARQGSDALALVAAMGTTGLLTGPPVIGFIANTNGLVWGMAAVAGSALLVAVLTTVTRWPAPAPAPVPAPAPAPIPAAGSAAASACLLPAIAAPPAIPSGAPAPAEVSR